MEKMKEISLEEMEAIVAKQVELASAESAFGVKAYFVVDDLASKKLTFLEPISKKEIAVYNIRSYELDEVYDKLNSMHGFKTVIKDWKDR